MDLHKKTSTIQKLLGFKCINISSTSSICNDFMDFNFNLSESELNNYICYTIVLNSYLIVNKYN